MSLDIRIDGQSVELTAGSSLDMNLVNPHFDYTKIPGSTANLPAFPLSRRNQQIFGYWEQPQVGGILQRRRFERYWGGHLIREAMYVLTEAGPAGYVGQMVEPLGEFFGDWQNESLTELDFGSLPLAGLLNAEINSDGITAAAFPIICNPDFYGTNGPAVNYNGKVNDPSGTGPQTPMILLTWLLKKISQATGTTIDGDFVSHPVFSKLLLYNTRALDSATTVNRHLPTLTVTELLLEIRKLFNLRFDFNFADRRLTIGFWQDAITKAAVVDWSAKAVGKAVKTPEVNTRLQLGYDLDSNDGLMKDKPAIMADYLTPGTPPNFAPLKSRFSTLMTDDIDGRTKAAQIGITAQFSQLGNTFAPRLLFWNGIVAGEPDASPQKGFYSLYWNGEDGLYENHWRELEAMRQTQFYAKQALDLTETDLAGLRWHQKVHINGVDYFVLSVNVSLPIIKPADCLLVAA
ncbi:hypothetical protein M0L20_18215 [Spirosoma sp. RP8]|uniref:Major capsid protein n=1 Tax=Spirosoma liriopis TaxID=2937440 RepID=A0ABT0HPL8_9BACT|nr:hypothetical protein [Spirosoma liriopis]MCK8493807.1 hypothetical protein [Spirosoma liriopis]